MLLTPCCYQGGFHSCLLDDDNVRQGLNKDLGFTNANHAEHVRRGEAGKLMTDAGLIVLMSFISPSRSERALVRDLFESGEFVEIFVDAPLAGAEQTDLEGPYNKSHAGEVTNFARLGTTPASRFARTSGSTRPT